MNKYFSFDLRTRLVLMLLVLPLFTSGQANSRIDSLENEAANGTSIVAKLDAFHQLSLTYARVNPRRLDSLLPVFLNLAKKQGDSAYISKAYCVSGVRYLVTGKFDESLLELETALALLPPSEDEAYRLNLYHYISGAHHGAGRLQKSLEYNAKVLEVLDQESNPIKFVQTLQGRAIILSTLGQVHESDSVLLACLSIATDIKADHVAANCRVLLGNSYAEQNRTQEAQQQFERALKMWQNTADMRGLFACHSRMGTFYHNISNFQASYEHYLTAFNLYDSLGFAEISPEWMGNFLDAAILSGNKDQLVELLKQYTAVLERKTLVEYEAEQAREQEVIEARINNLQSELLLTRAEHAEASNRENRNWLLLLSGLLLLSLVLLGTNFHFFRKTRSINLELKASNQNFYALNQSLEDQVVTRSKQVIDKNQQLLEVSLKLAHDVRGPLARMLGIRELIRVDVAMQRQQEGPSEHDSNSLDYTVLEQGMSSSLTELDTTVTTLIKELGKMRDQTGVVDEENPQKHTGEK